MRGKFTAADAHAAALTLAAYTIGLIPFVLMRSVVATFLARGDTATTVKAALTAAAVNIALKIVLLYTTDLAQVGLALATSIGAWINFGLLLWFGMRARLHRVRSPRSSARSAKLVDRRRRARRGACGSRSGRCWRCDRPAHSILALLLLAAIGAAGLRRRRARPVRQGVARAAFWRTPNDVTPLASAPPAPE